ncbi:acyltransferase [Jeotgalibacillus sp. S-D1]|nr:acyltransferase [Jeotgalibacillus sp. S-D1]
MWNLLWVSVINSESKLSLFVRYLYVRKYSASCGDNIYIGQGVIIKNIQYLELGSNISIHAYSYLDAAGRINIYNNVSIAHHSSLISFDHTWENSEIPIKYNKVVKGKILINEDVWIGCGCRILSNVTIGSRSVIAAGAVVKNDVVSKTLVGGVPAKEIKKI